MRNDSNWTGRTNRTLHEAFGPHVDRTIWEEVDPLGYGKVWWGCMALVWVAIIVLAVVGF